MRVFLVLSFLFMAGCATRAVETEAVLKAPPAGLPRKALVDGVPFVKQSTDYCGPATLSMTLAWSGKMVSVDELAKETFTPGASGTYQSDMIGASRRNGMLAVPIHGLPSLMKEVAAGHPVIVFENLAFKWYPMYHYALVYGYDLNAEDVTMHSGPVEAKRWDLRKFERSWMLGDYWGLVVLPPGRLAASVDDLAHATAASALEGLGHRDEARLIYESVLRKWPSSLSALIGLSNLDYAAGSFARAEELLSRAVKAHPSNAAAWHNLAIAQGATGHARLAHESAMKAISLAAPMEKAAYDESLKEYKEDVVAGSVRHHL
jgi:hypothetical protein